MQNICCYSLVKLLFYNIKKENMRENDYILPIARRLLDSLSEGQEIVATVKSCEPRMIIHKETIVGQYLDDGTIDWWEDKTDIEHTKIVDDAKNIINSK